MGKNSAFKTDYEDSSERSPSLNSNHIAGQICVNLAFRVTGLSRFYALTAAFFANSRFADLQGTSAEAAH